MKHYDNHEIEIRLNNEGYELIAGTDEVGRGPLAGPVVAACCIMPKDCYIEGVTDSKKISEKNRKILEGIIKEKAIEISVKDEGVGIANIKEAREPLYTTKPEEERSGMGFTFMEIFMDEVHIDSKVGEGTEVRMIKKIVGGDK
jgi:anti-sigma F factor